MKSHWLALSALCLVAAAWGVSFTMVKNVLGAIPPETFILGAGEAGMRAVAPGFSRGFQRPSSMVRARVAGGSD